MSEVLFYRCEQCGNIVYLVRKGGGTLTCCGQPMTRLEANTTDASKEKHVPDVRTEGSKIYVTIGSVEHPMVPEHYIQWIALVADDKVEFTYLQPGMEPKAEFTYYPGEEERIVTGENDEKVPNCEGQPCNFVDKDKKVRRLEVYEYCNIHGLWKKEL